MEEGKDYIIKTKFMVFMEAFNIHGIALPQIIGICDTKEIAEAVEKDLKEDNEFKNKRIFIAPIISGEKIPETKLKDTGD